MNRRAFLAGLFGTTVACAVPSVALEAIVDDDKWKADLAAVIGDFMYEFTVFGTAAIMHHNEYPYIRVLRAAELFTISEIDSGDL